MQSIVLRHLLRRQSFTLYPCARYSEAKKSLMPRCVHLCHRKLIEVEGRDATAFLQGMVTNDVERLPQMKCMYAMMLNQHGRVLHDLILYQHPEKDSIFVECQSDSAELLLKNLKFYKLRKKVKMNISEAFAIGHVLPQSKNENAPVPLQPIASYQDPRLPSLGNRIIFESSHVSKFDTSENLEGYHRKRILSGVPEGVQDLPPGDCLPLECNLDYMNGVSFHKGCYIGQELTARTKFTGVIRKRLVPITISGDEAPESGASLKTEKGKNAGKLRSCLRGGDIGLAVVRLNFLGEKLFTKAGQQIQCTVPPWWPYSDGTEFSDGVCGPNVD